MHADPGSRRPGAGSDVPVLSARGVSVSFGGVQALDDVSFDVGDGELVGLIGPNGAGKTTFVDAATGFVESTGRIELDRTDISALPPHEVALRGFARTWQTAELFDALTVRENLRVAHERPPIWRTLRDMVSRPRAADPEVDRTLEFLNLMDIADTTASETSQTQRKLTGVARALVARPRLLCMDEPAAGLDVVESKALGERLRQIADDGPPILLIDHDMGLVLSICDRVVVLKFGRVIAQGPPNVVRKDRNVVEAYLGAAASDAQAAAQ